MLPELSRCGNVPHGMDRKPSRRDRLYTGVIVSCLVIYLIIGFYVLSVYVRAAAPSIPVPPVPESTFPGGGSPCSPDAVC
jgi:hypothetical protein